MNTKRAVWVSLTLAIGVLTLARAADTAQTEGDRGREQNMREETRRIVAEERATREAQMAANSNLVQTPVPQWSAEVKGAPQVPLIRETNPPAAPAAAPAAVATPAATETKNPLWLILAVLAVLFASSLVKRLMRRRTPDA